jgi:transposase
MGYARSNPDGWERQHLVERSLGFIQLLQKGASCDQICEELELSRKTFFRWISSIEQRWPLYTYYEGHTPYYKFLNIKDIR